MFVDFPLKAKHELRIQDTINCIAKVGMTCQNAYPYSNLQVNCPRNVKEKEVLKSAIQN